MRTIKKHWLDVSSSPVDSETSPIRQIYVWLLTSDNQLVIVSNDGEHWQLPGGKPSNGEGVLQAANREVYEETGLDISGNSPIFFGEYTIDDHSSDTLQRYRQVRAYMYLQTDVVHHVRTVPLSEVGRHIKWLPYSEEYNALKRTKIIDVGASTYAV